jgi:hypothetical protein
MNILLLFIAPGSSFITPESDEKEEKIKKIWLQNLRSK